MKKLLKALGVAALIGSIPYAVTQNKEKDNLKIHALLWKATVSTDEEGEKLINVKLGFSNPFEHECCCGGHCHCHDDEDECCCEDDDCCCEDDDCCCEEVTEEDIADETPVEDPENN